MDVSRKCTTRLLLLIVATAAATAAAFLPQLPASADPSHFDPATLPRGDNPSLVYMVRDTIRDGSLTVPATRRGDHNALWAVAGGYLVSGPVLWLLHRRFGGPRAALA